MFVMSVSLPSVETRDQESFPAKFKISFYVISLLLNNICLCISIVINKGKLRESNICCEKKINILSSLLT